MNFQRSMNRLLIAGTAALLIGAPGLAQAQLGRVNAPGTDLGNSAFDWAPPADSTGSGFSFRTANVTIDVTADLNWNGIITASENRTGTFAAGIYRARTTLKDNSNVTLPNPPQALVSVCNDLFNGAEDDASNDWFRLTGNELNANKDQLAYLVDTYMGPDGSNFDALSSALINVGSVSANEAGAGFQLAVWELWYDNGASLASKGLSLGRGFIGTASADILTAANKFLADAAANGIGYYSSTALRLRDLADSDGVMQGMLISANAPIPEPAFYQMAGLLTLGILGMRRLRKKA